MTAARRQNLVIAILCLSNVVCVIALWRAKNDGPELRAEMAAATEDLATSRSITPPRPGSRSSARPDRGEPFAAVSAMTEPRRETIVYRADMIRAHPEYAALWEKETRRGMLAKCDQMLATLDRSPEQIARLRDLVVEQFHCMADAQELVRAQGLNPGTAEYMAAFERPRKEVDDRLRELLGDDYERVMRFPTTQAYKLQLETDYAVNFRDANALLSSEQTLKLAELMTNVLGRPDQPRRADEMVELDGLRTSEKALLRQASRFLAPEQLEVMRARFREENQRASILATYPPNLIVLP